MLMETTKILPVILSGGSGTRLWPFSTGERPKQYLNLIGNRSPFEQALERAHNPDLFLPPLVICNHTHEPMVRELLTKSGHEHSELILEPCGRNTGPAIITALLAAQNHAPGSLVLIIPADHHIPDTKAFQSSIRIAAEEMKDSQSIGLFGVKPTSPETAYGYIETNEQGTVTSFTEKPDKITAEQYLKSGRYLWNAGLFLLRPDTLLPQIKQHCKDTLEHAQEALKNAAKSFNARLLGESSFAKTTAKSFDKLILEQYGKWKESADRSIFVHSCSFAWSDLGSWQALSAFTYTERPDSVQKPWGKYRYLNEGPGYATKQVIVNPRQRTSLQSHKHRSEHWIIISGTANVIIEDTQTSYSVNETAFIPAGHKHRLENNSDEPLLMIEVQNGELLAEDDIERYDDDYGRQNRI